MRTQCILTLVVHILNVGSLPPIIRIGAIFSKSEVNSSTELAFKYAVHTINRDKGMLPDTTLMYDIQYVDETDSFHACKKVCNQIKTGVHAILGPSNGLLSCHINSICDALDIPHIEIRADAEHTAREFSINLHPFQDIINDAFLDIIHYLNWTKVAILHENQHGLVQLRRLMQTSLEVHVRYVNPLTYVQYLNEMKEMEMHNLILDTKTDNVHIILKTILKLQMNEYKYHYFITSFDIEKFDLEDFKYNFANITSFCLVDVNDVRVKKTLKELEIYKNLQKPSNEGLQFFRKLHTVETISALIYDSVHIFVIGLQSLQQSHFLRVANVSCESPQTWKGGLSLINYINSVEWKGLTGPIRFKEGRRTQFKLDLVKLKQHSIVKIGEWSPHMRLNITEPSLFFDTGSMNVTLVVITILEKPYVMMRYGKNYTGNNRFYGFCVDVLRLVARDVGFDYILDLVPDRKYGAKDPLTGQWNGMVEQLMKYKADLAVGSMTITYARESVIDFTKPFMNLGISILFKVPSTPSTKLFSFMNPLAFDVWLYVLAAYFCVSITIHAMAKISLIERSNFNRSSKYFVKYLDKFTLRNSFWFAVGTLMQQSSNLKPRAISVRIVSAIWWFFSLIIIASYTANLAAFLTVERMTTPIENAEDLSSQTEISYGTLESGSTMTFFRDSLIETYRKMWRNMENIKKHSTFTSTYEEGIKRVKESNYAFLMESTMLDYVVQRDCNLTQIGGLLDTKGYGIATPKGSPWRDKISLAILELQEKGDIQMLYDKWWKSVGETCFPRSNTKQSKANALGFDNIGGVFVALFFGIVFAIFMALFEFWQYYTDRKRQQQILITEDVHYFFEEIYQQQYCDDIIAKKELEHYCYSFSRKQYGSRHNHRSMILEMFEEARYVFQCINEHQRLSMRRNCIKCQQSRNLRISTGL